MTVFFARPNPGAAATARRRGSATRFGRSHYTPLDFAAHSPQTTLNLPQTVIYAPIPTGRSEATQTIIGGFKSGSKVAA